MPPPKTFDDTGSDSDSDAPEAVSSKAASKKASEEAKRLHALQDERKRKEKDRRRETDRRLKAQKEEKRLREKEQAETSRGANRQEGTQIGGGAGVAGEIEDWRGVDEEDESSMDEDIPDYLPDEMFEKAAAEARTNQIQAELDALSDSDDSIRETTKRRRKPKKIDLGYQDKVVGTRVIRKIEKPALTHLASVSSAAPRSHTRKFLKRSLGLSNRSQASNQPSGGRFTRRPVNLGILKGSGPASGFARSLQT